MIYHARNSEARALYEGRQTRIIVPAKVKRGTTLADMEWEDNPDGIGRIGRVPLRCIEAPFAPGSRIAVKEAWRSVPRTAYRMSVGVCQTDCPHDPDLSAIYRAGWERSIPKWQSSAVMPAWAVRTYLIAGEVMAFRIQDVTEEMARETGVDHGPLIAGRDVDIDGDFWPTSDAYRRGFRAHWTARHGEDAWERNPWAASAAVKKETDHAEP